MTRILTTVVGSYPQPDWLIDRERLGDRLPPRVRAHELWRVAEPLLEQAQDDATRLAVADMEQAGVDVITDGEMRRESYSNRFATALAGVDLETPGVALDRTGHENPVPRVVGPVRRTRPVEVRDVEFLRSLTDRRIKITVPGPFTMTQQAQNDHYPDDRSLALAYAEAVNEELRDLKAAGADLVQIDEPYLQARPEPAREYAVEAINRALDGIEGETVLHTCFGYAHIVHDRLPGYPFLDELADCSATHLSLEAAQPDLDPSLLGALAGQDDRARRPRSRLARGRDGRRRRGPASPRARRGAAGAARRRTRLRDEVSAARARAPQARSDGRRRPARVGRADAVTSLRIAVLAPVSWRVPPRHYGPWEQFASLLTEGLVARGVDVTLFATADSITSGRLDSVVARSYSEDAGVDPKVVECLHIAHAFERADEFDVIHNSFDFLPLSYCELVDTPLLTTIHGFSSELILPVYQRYNASGAYVAISDADRHPTLDYLATIHHGIDTSAFSLQSSPGGYLLFFGRIHPDKGTAEAIDVADASGLPLVIAGIIQDQAYFDERVAPRLDGNRISFVGPVRAGERSALLGGAHALLHLIGFDEPFGYSVVESMACGTPVIAFRRGSMGELIQEGATGFLVDDLAGAVAAVDRAASLDRAAIRADAVSRFDVARMVDDYLDAYAAVVSVRH